MLVLAVVDFNGMLTQATEVVGGLIILFGTIIAIGIYGRTHSALSVITTIGVVALLLAMLGGALETGLEGTFLQWAGLG